MSVLICSYCENEISDDSDFCPRCGSLFAKNVKCKLHDNLVAVGVCLICSEPFCNECGCFTNRIFLCNEHSTYEIYEGLQEYSAHRIHFSVNTLRVV